METALLTPAHVALLVLLVLLILSRSIAANRLAHAPAARRRGAVARQLMPTRERVPVA